MSNLSVTAVWIDAWAAVGLSFFGLLIGSFLNVVIARVPLDQSIVRPRSRCPQCSRSLAWYENIPVLSWLYLRGRCRGCRKPISVRYPLVELLTGFLFLACLRRFGWNYELVLALVLVTLLVPLTFIDLEHWLLPLALTLPGIVLGLGLSIPLGLERFRDACLGAAVAFTAFWGLEWIGQKIFKKEALGGGDKFQLALLGSFLTVKSLLGLIFLSSFQGALIGSSLLVLRGRAGPAPVAHSDEWVPGPTNLPFGPWLALAGLELLLFGPWLQRVLPAGLRLLAG